MITKSRWISLFFFCLLAISLMTGGCNCSGIVAIDWRQTVIPDGGLIVMTEVIPEKCVPGNKVPCQTGQRGVCAEGESLCVDGKWSKCQRTTEPSAEICDDLDNDCDGLVDEQLKRECPYPAPPQTKNVSHCRAGTQVCKEGQWGVCVGENLPLEEICNGKDDDCDGAIDEWLPIQKIGLITTYSHKGDPTHLFMVSNPSGYTFGWSELPERRVLMSRVKINGTRYKGDWVITPKPGYGNIHGLTWTGKKYVISWDTDRAAGGDAVMSPISASGKHLSKPVLLAKGGRMVNPYVASSPTMLGVIWQDYTKRRLYAQPFDHNLKPLSGAKFYPVSSIYSPYPGLAVLENRMAISWITNNRQLWVSVIDKNGREVHSQVIANAGGVPKDSYLSPNQDGFLLVWVDNQTNRLLSLRLNRDGKPMKKVNVVSSFGSFTPILRPTSFGGVLAWIQNNRGDKGISVARIDRDGKLLSKPSFQSIPGARDYITLAWTDLGKGTGRGAVAWIDRNNAVKVAPLGCQP